MFTRNRKLMFNWFSSFMIVLLIGLLLPTGSASAQSPAPPPKSIIKHLPANGVRSPNLVGSAPLTSLSGTNLLQDPSFEASFGSTTYWQQFSTNFGTPLCSVAVCGTGINAAPRSGSVWAFFGGVDFTVSGMISPEIGDIYQNVTFPSCVASLQFYFWF